MGPTGVGSVRAACTYGPRRDERQYQIGWLATRRAGDVSARQLTWASADDTAAAEDVEDQSLQRGGRVDRDIADAVAGAERIHRAAPGVPARAIEADRVIVQ